MHIDVSRDPMRMIRDRSRPFHVPGTAVEITVPFTGEAETFKIQPTTYTLNPPQAQIEGDTLTLTLQGTALDAAQLRAEIDRRLASINSRG